MRKSFLFLLLLFLSILSLSISGYLYYQSKRLAVVDVLRLVNEFDMKKELESRVEPKFKQFQEEIDSLKGIELKESNNLTRKRIEELLARKNQEFQMVYELSNKNINEQIWNRLNPLINEFGTEYNYRMIIGANGMGTVLYSGQGDEITDKLIKYVNNKYGRGS